MARAIVDGEADVLEGAWEGAEREREGAGDLIGVVAEDPATPGAEHQGAVLVGRGDREHLLGARLEHLADRVACIRACGSAPRLRWAPAT